MTGASESTPADVEAELDIFSGMPNPTWTLLQDDADRLEQRLAALPRTSATELAGNLGYRGFIVRVKHGSGTQLVRIQAGTVRISERATTVYAADKGRELERWLLDTGRPHLKDELFEVAARELR